MKLITEEGIDTANVLFEKWIEKKDIPELEEMRALIEAELHYRYLGIFEQEMNFIEMEA